MAPFRRPLLQSAERIPISRGIVGTENWNCSLALLAAICGAKKRADSRPPRARGALHATPRHGLKPQEQGHFGADYRAGLFQKRPDVQKIVLSIKSRPPPPPRKSVSFEGFALICTVFPHFGPFPGGVGKQPNFADKNFVDTQTFLTFAGLTRIPGFGAVFFFGPFFGLKHRKTSRKNLPRGPILLCAKVRLRETLASLRSAFLAQKP